MRTGHSLTICLILQGGGVPKEIKKKIKKNIKKKYQKKWKKIISKKNIQKISKKKWKKKWKKKFLGGEYCHPQTTPPQDHTHPEPHPLDHTPQD